MCMKSLDMELGKRCAYLALPLQHTTGRRYSQVKEADKFITMKEWVLFPCVVADLAPIKEEFSIYF